MFSPAVSFVKSQSTCFSYFLSQGLPARSPLPARSEDFWTFFGEQGAPPGTQRALTLAINRSRHSSLVSSFPPSSPDRARMVSLGGQHAGDWLTCPPLSDALFLHNASFSAACRLRLGLAPCDDLRFCVCGANLRQHPLHFLSCSTLRPLATARHDRLLQILARTGRQCGTTVQVEPSLGASSDDGARADGHFFFTSVTVFIDVSVVHPAAPSYVKQGHRFLSAASRREKQKEDLYLDRAKLAGGLFFPFVLDSFGALGKKAVSFLSRLRDEAVDNGLKEVSGISTNSFLYRSLSICLQAGNAAILLDGARRARAKLSRAS